MQAATQNTKHCPLGTTHVSCNNECLSVCFVCHEAQSSGSLNVTPKSLEVENTMHRHGALGVPVAALQPHTSQRLPPACPGVLTQGCCALRGPDQAAAAAAAAESEAVELSTSCWPDEPARSHLEACQGDTLQMYNTCRTASRCF